MKVYYAHCIALYNTVQERRDIDTLLVTFQAGPVEIVNPNSPEVEQRCSELRKEVEYINGRIDQGYQAQRLDASEIIMSGVFKPLVRSCDVLAFRALYDGSVTAGVAKEIEYALEASIPVIELPSSVLRRTLNVEQTREYLREIGQR